METQVEQLDGDRVRLTVEVPAGDISHAVEHATSDLAKNVKIPGFRKGKVPTQVLVSKMGKEAVYSEAVDSHLSNWFWKAVTNARAWPTDQPDFDYELPASANESWQFTAEYGVNAFKVADWKKLEVTKKSVEVPDESVARELESLQRAVADLSPADRTAQVGDVAVVDIISAGGYGQRDYVFELGSERMADEIEGAVRGMVTGETREVNWQLSDGSVRQGSVTLKELHEKVLAPLDDELAKSVSEFDSLKGLRADIEGRLHGFLEDDAKAQFRQAAIDELVKASNLEPQGLAVNIRTRELFQGFIRQLERRGIDPGQYLQITNTTVDDLEARLHEEAKQSMARELLLEAVADKLDIEVSDDEVRAELRSQGEEDRHIDEFFERGGADTYRPELRMKKALDRIVEEVKPVSEAGAAIWTPEKGKDKEKEKEKKSKQKKLWTPGSKETS